MFPSRNIVDVSISYRIIDIETGLYMKTKTIKEAGQYRDDNHQGGSSGEFMGRPS